jgi:hypothetical protein
MKTKEKVKYWLEKYPHLRDDDNRLFANIWDSELERLRMPRDVRKHFLILIAQGKLTSAPSIKRARAKLQEEDPKLRGEKYYKRKGIYQEEWRKNLGYAPQ